MRVITYPQQFHLPEIWKKKGSENLNVQDQPLGGTEERRDGWQPRQLPKFQYPRGARLYLFHEAEHDTNAPTEAEGGSAWRRPHTFKPIPTPLYGFGGFRAAPEGGAPIDGIPVDSWQPRQIKVPGKYNPARLYFNRIGDFRDENVEASPFTQFQVQWAYGLTRYERTVRQFLRRHLQNTGLEFSGGNSEPSPLSYTPRKLRPFQLPRSVPYSYWVSGDNTGNAPIEAEAAQSWVARPLARFVRPRGATLYYMQSGFGSTSVPVVGTVVGRVTGLEHRPNYPTIIR